MIYFTISGAYFPAQSGRVIYVDNGVSISIKPTVRRIKFGDGYGLHVPIAPPLRGFSASFSNRAPEEINVIEEYLGLLTGELIPDFSVMGVTYPMVCTKFSKSYQNGEIYSLSAEFTQEFR